MRRLAIVLALLLIGAAAWWLRSADRPRTAPAASGTHEAPSAAAPPVTLTAATREPVPVSGRDAVEPPVAPAPAVPRDPTAEDLSLLRRGCGETGTICGVVLRGLERMAGARVRLWPMAVAPQRYDVGNRPGTWNATTAESGEFLFAGLVPEAYLLRVDSPEGAHREANVILGEVGGSEQVVVFGTGCIAGRVLDVGGGPLAGIEVFVGGLGADGGSATQSRAWTDAAGAFEVCGLPAAVYWVNPRWPARQPVQRQWRLALGPGGRSTVRLGALASDPRFEGRVVDARGRSVPWVHLLLEDAGSGLWWRVIPDEAASFAETLPPGRYRIGVVFPEQNLLERGIDAGELELGARDVQQDIVMPGVRVDLRFVLEGEPAPAEVLEVLWPHVRRQGASGNRRIYERDGERFVCLALEPGDHQLELYGGYVFAEGDERYFPFEVPAGARNLEIEVPIRARE